MSATRTVGKYEIWEEIARGGMGIVYRGFQPSLGRVVAIKMLLPELARDPDFQTRFQNEAGAIALLNQSNIVRIHDIEYHDSTYYIIMEFVAGPSLRPVLKGAGRLDPERAADLVSQAATALEVAHAEGIIHRDIKPENLLLTTAGVLKVMDFGVAKMVRSDFKTQTGTALGTPAYMSPEQARGEKVDARSDLYALATMLFELTTGQLPFQDRNPFAIAVKHMTEPPPDPRVLRPEIPPALGQLILYGLQKPREARFQSASEMRAALRPFADAGRRRSASGVVATGGSCPNCGVSLRPDFEACPSCGSPLEAPCRRCRQPYRAGRAVCPYCWTPAAGAEEITRAAPGAPAPGPPPPPPPVPSPVPPAPGDAPGVAGGGGDLRQRVMQKVRDLDPSPLLQRLRRPAADAPPAAGLQAGTMPSPPPASAPPYQCPRCGGNISPDFVRCPFCGGDLHTA
ncbi:MAG: protein kinase [bacterium]|nr:protein kinase [bacterium]